MPEVAKVRTATNTPSDRRSWVLSRHAAVWELLNEASSDDLRHQAAALIVAAWALATRYGADEFNWNPGFVPWVEGDGDYWIFDPAAPMKFRAFATLADGATGYARRIHDDHPAAAALIGRGEFGWFASLRATGYPVRGTVHDYAAEVLDVLRLLSFDSAPWSQAIGTAAMHAEQAGGSGGGGGSGSGSSTRSKWLPWALAAGAAWLFFKEGKRAR